MTTTDLSQAFVSVSIGEERVLDSYARVVQLLLAKQRLLETNSIPFSLRDEIDLNSCVLSYVDACISQISTMQKLAGVPKLTLPIPHDLLRKYRDANHHIGYHPFAPYRSIEGTKFFISPVLGTIEAVKVKYPNWCLSPNRQTLADLLNQNHEYISQLIRRAKIYISSTGKQIRFYHAYNIGEVSFGP